MIRFLSVPCLFVLACLLSGIYGALHNQISYSVSAEYFTKFKFDQFDIAPQFHDRFGAAMVGWQAAWWMGVVIGFFLIPAGLLVRDTWGYVVAVLRSFVVVLCTTCIVGLGALFISYLVVHADPNDEFVLRNSVVLDPTAFQRASAMHNFSYIGGFIGIITGLTSILRSFLAENSRLHPSHPDG